MNMLLDERVGAIVLQAGNTIACLRDRVEVEFGDDEAGEFAAGVGQDGAARVDDEGVAVGAAAARVRADLRGGQDERACLDGPRTQQRVPVLLACHHREGCGHRQNGRARLCQTTVQLREAQVCSSTPQHIPSQTTKGMSNPAKKLSAGLLQVDPPAALLSVSFAVACRCSDHSTRSYR